MLKLTHGCHVSYCFGDWRFNGRTGYIHLYELELNKTKSIPFSEVAFKGMHLSDKFARDNCICCKGERYRNCDISFPCIVTEASNPYNRKYRVIDGKHRMMKMVALGMTHANFYVLDANELLKHMKESRT